MHRPLLVLWCFALVGLPHFLGHPSPGPHRRVGRVFRADCQSRKLSRPVASLLFPSCLAAPPQSPFLRTFRVDIPPRFYPTSTSLSSDFHHHGLSCHFYVTALHPSRASAAPSAWKLLPWVDPSSLPHCLQDFAQMSPTAIPEGHSEIISLLFSLLFLECRISKVWDLGLNHQSLEQNLVPEWPLGIVHQTGSEALETWTPSVTSLSYPGWTQTQVQQWEDV